MWIVEKVEERRRRRDVELWRGRKGKEGQVNNSTRIPPPPRFGCVCVCVTQVRLPPPPPPPPPPFFLAE